MKPSDRTLMRGYKRAYRESHREQIRAAGAAYREANRGQIASRRSARFDAPEYRAWIAAKQRTANPNNKNWSLYGGRGIRMAAEWATDFPAFLAHIGPRPGPEYSLDRIDPNGNYEPGNVRWATVIQQRRNQRRQDVAA